jgi:hypothetical protein
MLKACVLPGGLWLEAELMRVERRTVLFPLAFGTLVPITSAASQQPNCPPQASSLLSGIPILVAILAAVSAYAFNVRLEKRKADLAFVSDQLEHLYGPLNSICHAQNQAWEKFIAGCKPGGVFFDPANPPSQGQVVEWRHWMSEVFMPLNLLCEDIIMRNAHLIADQEMPQSFLDLLAHVETYKAVIKKWPSNPVSFPVAISQLIKENTASENYPTDLKKNVEEKFKELQSRQAKLIGRKTI